MKNLIMLVVVVAGVAGLSAFLIITKDNQLDEAQYMQKLNNARMEFMMQMPFSIQAPDDKIDFERRQVMKDFREKVKKINKQHPKMGAPDRFITEREQQAKDGKKDKKKVAGYRERYDYLKGRFEELSAQGYKPVLSQYKNGVRYDISKMAKGEDGKLRVDIFIWGPPERQFSFGAFSIKYPLVTRDARGKIKGQPGVVNIDGQGPPYLLHEDPYEWIPEWGPGIMAGHYTGLPLFAPQAEKFNLILEMGARTAGGTNVPVKLEWKGLEVKDAWKDPDTAKWEDVEGDEASEEDLKEFGLE